MNRTLALCAALAVVVQAVNAREHRSAAARDQYRREHPCPANGQTRAACPSYAIDDVIPLCAGGGDKGWRPAQASGTCTPATLR